MAEQTMQCRVKEGGEGGDGMKTVECLRGRLLAERVASKAAKEEADQLSKRLDELEKKLADEVKVRNKAERRLRKAIKKLESLKILDVELSDGSIGSLSSNGRSGHQAPEVEESNNLGSLSSTDSAQSSPPGDGASSAGSCTLVNNSSQDGSSCSVVSEQSPAGPCNLGDTSNNCSPGASAGDHDSDRQQLGCTPECPAKSEQDSRNGDDDRLALVLVDPQLVAGGDDTRTQGNNTVQAHEQEAQEEDNRLALVLVDPQPQPAAAPKPHGDVESVLIALQRVKEQLRYTIERRSELVAHREVYGH
ncbi:hypothetical protein QOZ80_3BG0284460 [Eleusine coracana subsp. coracana]|nr:hypothetical protein QOZ80_3BG0284460 [Eleusine coracana subsp. coracana]